MSVHSELQNVLKNKSGNAALTVRSRSGESEEGNALFDLMPSAAPSAFEVVTQSEQQSARKQFLVAYFTLLKERLNRFEFEYVKQLYAEGQAESVICDNLGLNPKKFKRGLMKKLTASAADIDALVAASDWDDADLFSRCFLSAPQDIQDVNELSFLPKTVKGFGNLIERLAYRRYRKLYKKGWYQRSEHSLRRIVNINHFSRDCKGLVKSAGYIARAMSFDTFCSAAKCYGLEVDREKLAGLEAFYNTFYDSLCNVTQELYDYTQGRKNDITTTPPAEEGAASE